MIEIWGFVNPGFEAVRAAFAENFGKRKELGGAGTASGWTQGAMRGEVGRVPAELAGDTRGET